MQDVNFTIPVIPITKKNHSQIVKLGKRHILLPSKQYRDYQKQATHYLPKLEQPIDEPVNIKATFYVPTRRRCDLTNHLESIDDVLVAGNVIADDNCTIVVSHDGSRVLYDKYNPRTEISITEIISEFESYKSNEERREAVLEDSQHYSMRIIPKARIRRQLLYDALEDYYVNRDMQIFDDLFERLGIAVVKEIAEDGEILTDEDGMAHKPKRKRGNTI